jgi:uncharacterized protein (DUF58 family)
MPNVPIVLLLLLAIAILLRVDFVFYLVYVLAGTYMLANWWTGRSLGWLRLHRRFTDHAFLGEKVGVEIEVENSSWWPVPWLRCQEAPPPAIAASSRIHQVVALRPKERLRLRYDLLGAQRGYYELGPTILGAGDLFGFAESQGRYDQPDHLTVYPRVIPLASVALASRSPHGTVKSQQPIFADPARVKGVREYQPGDPLAAVNWKSSARAGRLMVKRYEPAVSLTTVIALEMHTPSYTRQVQLQASEWGIVVAASLANYLMGQRQAVGLICNGTDPLTGADRWTIPPRGGRPHLMKLLEWLARVQLVETTALADWLPTACLNLAWGTTVIAVTPTGDEATCRALHRLLRAGLNPVLAVVEPHGQFGVVRERARRLGIAAYLAADERELQQWGATIR